MRNLDLHKTLTWLILFFLPFSSFGEGKCSIYLYTSSCILGIKTETPNIDMADFYLKDSDSKDKFALKPFKQNCGGVSPKVNWLVSDPPPAELPVGSTFIVLLDKSDYTKSLNLRQFIIRRKTESGFDTIFEGDISNGDNSAFQSLFGLMANNMSCYSSAVQQDGVVRLNREGPPDKKSENLMILGNEQEGSASKNDGGYKRSNKMSDCIEPVLEMVKAAQSVGQTLTVKDAMGMCMGEQLLIKRASKNKRVSKDGK